MSFLTSRRGAALITAVVVVFSIIFGAGRSLNAVRDDIWAVWDQGINGDGHSVREDLGTRYATCANLYTVAARYLPEGELSALKDVLGRVENSSLEYFDELDPAARAVMDRLGTQSLSEQDAKYVAGFRQELDSRAFSIAHDPYTEMAQAFNDRTLTAFPANLLHRVAGVEPLPVYQ